MTPDGAPIDDPGLLAILRDGRRIPIQPCCCGACNNEFFVAAMSVDWHPSYCPYCGIKFTRKEVDGAPDEFKPKRTV